MSQENEFDNAFKERLGNMDFEFKDAYWTEMSALMDGKKKKRGLLFWWISTGSVAAVLLLMGVVYFMGQESQKQWTGFVNVSNSDSVDSNIIQDGDSSNFTSDVIGNSNKAAGLISDQTRGVSENHNNSSTKNGRPLQTNTSANSTSASTRLSQKDLVSSKAKSNSQAENSFNNDDFLKNQTDRQQHTLSSSQIHVHDKLIINPMEVLFAFPMDKNKSVLGQLNEEQFHPRKTFYSHVGIVAGTTFGQSLQTQDGAVGGLGSHLGLRFYFAGRNGFQVSTGLSFGVNQIKGLVYEEHRTIFGYAQYDVVNTIKYQSMLTANVPLYLGYEGYRFSVSGGLRLNYIMNTKGRVYTWDNSVYDQSIWGYAHGIKYFNMGLGLEATYQLARRWDLGFSFDMDLSSRSEENNDLISPEARLWQTGIFLKYRIN
jgi:hypothetical protein